MKSLVLWGALVGLGVTGCRDRSDHGTATATTTASSAVVTPASSPNEASLQGRWSLRMPDKPDRTIECAFKGKKVLLGLWSADAAGHQAGAEEIIDHAASTTTLVYPERHEYAPIAPAAAGGPVAMEETPGQVQITRAPGDAFAGGHRCQEWTLANDRFRVHACVVPEGPSLDLVALERASNVKAPPWLKAIADKGYLPVRVEVRSSNDEPLPTPAAATLDTAPLDDSLFEVPWSYTKKDVLP